MSHDTVLLLVGLFGGGTILGIIKLVFIDRNKAKVDDVATIVTASGEVVKLSSGLLATYVIEVQKLTERVARLEGLLDQRDARNRWLTGRVHQLEEYIHEVCNFPVPTPVIEEELP